MSKSAFLIATQYDNLGDLIINKCLIDELSKHTQLYIETKNVSPEFISQIKLNPDIKFLKPEMGFSFKDYSVLKYFIKYHKHFDYLFKSPGPIRFSRKHSLNSWIKSNLMNAIFRKMRTGNGKSFVIGSEITLESESLVKKLQRASFIFNKFYLRSKENVEYLDKLNIRNAEYIPDLCFLIREKVKPADSRNKVGISFRDLDHIALDQNIKSSIKVFVDFYHEKGYQIVFFYQVTRDREYNKMLFSEYEGTKNVFFREKELTLDEIDFYKDFKNVMSNRLHVLLLAFVHNALTIPLIGDNSKTNKIKGIYKSIESSIPSFDILQKSDLEEQESNYLEIITEIDGINQYQYALCQQKISELFQTN